MDNVEHYIGIKMHWRCVAWPYFCAVGLYWRGGDCRQMDGAPRGRIVKRRIAENQNGEIMRTSQSNCVYFICVHIEYFK